MALPWLLCSLLLWLRLLSAAGTLEKSKFVPGHLTYQGLTHCGVREAGFDSEAGPVYVSDLTVRPLLCRTETRGFRPCLQIHINISLRGFHDDQEMSGDHSGSGQDVTSSSATSVRVCYTLPASLPVCSRLRFTVLDPPAAKMWLSWVVKPMKLTFGSLALISSSSTLHKSSHLIIKETTFPSIPEVCSAYLDIEECDAPTLIGEIDWKVGVAILRLDDSNKGRSHDLRICQKLEETGRECLDLQWGVREDMRIPLSSVAPCMCFQVWWNKRGIVRRLYCPFLNDTALLETNVSVSVVEAQAHSDGGDDGDGKRTALAWNITAPCRLEAEVWLCRKGAGLGDGCQEVKDVRNSRQHTHNHTHTWKWSQRRHWIKGEFIKVERHPSLCVQVKVKGIERDLGPLCPFEVSRVRWSLPLVVCVLLVCVTIPGAYIVQGTLKGWVCRWLKVDDVKGAVGGGHVVLLYPPEEADDGSLAMLVCRLAESLQALGLSVSLDLWSRTELGALGPVPWLHSRLDRLQRHGGKVVLVLTRAAWERAEEWGGRGWEKGDEQGEEKSRAPPAASAYQDVFGASLSCVLADYLQGRAGERFVLAQFEARPPRPPGTGGASGPLPELFRGLPLYSLPSQSLAFLTELAVGGAPGGRGRGAEGWRRRAGGLRAASRALAGGLRGLAGGAGAYRLPGLSQDCVGGLAEGEDSWESVPLQPCQSTPPSPEPPARNNGVDWV